MHSVGGWGSLYRCFHLWEWSCATLFFHAVVTFQFLQTHPSRVYSASLRKTYFHFCSPHTLNSPPPTKQLCIFGKFKTLCGDSFWRMTYSIKGVWTCVCVVGFADDHKRIRVNSCIYSHITPNRDLLKACSSWQQSSQYLVHHIPDTASDIFVSLGVFGTWLQLKKHCLFFKMV